ncbi:MAG: hypothetical protein VZR36_12895 [Prevotella sp.]|nr:hypothetical protein [Prevotella sp.]
MLRLFNNNGSANEEKQGTRWFATYLVVAAVFLTVTSLQGISYYDIGFYLSGYQHFNDDPFASYFLAQWYLTFRSLGFVCNALGIDTFLGLRILRTLFLLVFQTIIYLYLRKSIKTKYIIGGMAMTTLAQYGAYSEINYNDLSIFLLVCAILLYHKAITQAKQPNDQTTNYSSPKGGLVWVFLSGFLIGISIFLRLVNLTFLALPFFAIIVCLYYKKQVSWWRHLACFFFGVVVGSALILGIAWVDGTFGVLQQTFSDLVSISTDSADKHSFGMIVRFYLYDVLAEVKMSLFIAFVIYGFIIARTQASRKLIHLAYALLSAVIIYVVWQDGKAGNITVGFCLSLFLLDFFTQRLITQSSKFKVPLDPKGRFHSEAEKECSKSKVPPKRPNDQAHSPRGGWVGVLYTLAMFIPLVFPFGSNGTNQFYGQMLCILAMPLAVATLMRGSSLKVHNSKFKVQSSKLAGIYIIAAICIGMTVTNVLRPMMEDGNRLQCRYTIDSHATGPLLTNEDNAALHNRMVREVKPLIPQGSHLICNFSITMISVLECRPYAIFADGYSTPERAEQYLHAAYERSRDGKQLPFLLVDEESETDCFRHIRTVLSSLAPYEEIWRSENYVLLKPTNKVQSSKK